jgi:hypothetical protein
MDRHELQARTDAQTAEWKRNLDVMRARAGTAGADAKVRYSETVAQLQQQFDEFKIDAAKTWDAADDRWDQTAKDLENKWAEWELRARSALNELTKPR